MMPSDQDKDNPLTSIFHLATIVDTLRQDDVVPDFQRVTITGEETSGVSRSLLLSFYFFIFLIITLLLLYNPQGVQKFK